MPKGIPNSGVRKTRAQATRAEQPPVHQVEDEPWTRPSSLEAPPKRPGYVQRWIRVGSRGTDDPTNIARKFREGWKPRPADTIPSHFHAPTISHGRYAGFVGVEGMVLCEMPEERNNQRNKYYRNKRDRMTQAVNDQLAGINTQVTPGFGPIKKLEKTKLVREVSVAPDEDAAEEATA